MSERVEKVPEDYNAGIAMIAFDTWWELGQFAGRLSETRDESAKLAIAVDHISNGAPKFYREEFPAAAELDPKRLVQFVETVVPLLEKKYAGEPIAHEVEKLCQGGRVAANDDGQFLTIQEDDKRFWATEYAGLFGELTPGRQRDDWRYAVTRCGDDACGKFFIKRRANQLYHADKCRFNKANRAKTTKRGRRVGGRR